jgi:hypothetical protein
LKKEHRGMVPGGSDLSDAEDRGNGHRGSMTDIISVLHQSDIPCSKGERLFRGSSKEFRQGEQPQGEFKQGEQPQDEEWPFSIDVKGGELITLM